MGVLVAEAWSSERPGDDQNRRLRRYSVVVTTALILVCNALLLLGIWGSDVNLESLFRVPEVFNPSRDICLRRSWHKVAGVEQPVQLCYEWINLSDPTGETHTFQNDAEVVRGADGRLHYDYGWSRYRLIAYGGFVIAVTVSGLLTKRYLIARYRTRLNKKSDS
jgi:hypothetical protein